jgi:DNA-binding transcriptional LysR family regulator
MEIRQLQYFTTIARTGGFRHASDALNVSQATLSEQIKFLEHELGVRLFERGGRGLTLTEAGRALLERAEHMLAEVKATREEMLEFAQLDRGQLTFGAVMGTGPSWLPSFLAAFLKCHPHVDVRLVERTSAPLFQLLESGDLHVACLLVPAEGGAEDVAPPGICVRRLYTRNLVVVVAPHHRLARRATVTLSDLAGERLILTSPEEAPRSIVDHAFRAQGIEPLVRFEANDPSALIGLAAEGVGIGITGERRAREQTDRVVTVPIEGVSLRYSMALAWSERGARTRPLESFVQFATDWLGEWGVRTHATRCAVESV